MESKKTLILIIDDEEALRDGCKQALERSGYDVITAGEGVEGIRLARETKPDLAYIDLKMPGMSGMDIIEILSKDIPDIVTVMITGFASIVSAVEAVQKGAYDYLPKPFSPEQLRALTLRALDHRRLKVEARILKEEKERMQKAFITFVSHEMRSPLVVIRQSFETLKAVTEGRFGNEVAEIIDRCSKRIQGLEALVEHWLDISRIEQGTFAQKKESLSMAELIAKSAEEMGPLCSRKGIELRTSVPPDLQNITGDEESLIRVFTNLIGNASKYTPEGGTITVSARCEGPYILAEVTDTGSGIPQDKLPFIFEPFYRVKGKTDPNRGSGLGLSYCKKIMEMHGGDISARSQEGKGSTFTIMLPV